MLKKNRVPAAAHWESAGYDKGRKTRRRIVEVATKMFANYGYETTSIDRIGLAAGLTKGAIYGHFKRKRALYIACLDNALSFFREQVEIDRALSADDALLHYMNWLGAKFSQKAVTRALFMQLLREADDPLITSLVKDLMDAPFHQLRDLIAAVNPHTDSTAAAFLIVSGLLLDPDMHRYYVLMAGVHAAHDTPSTVSRLFSMIKYAR